MKKPTMDEPRNLGLKDVIAMMYGKNYEMSEYAYVKLSTVPFSAPYVGKPLAELFGAMLAVGDYNGFNPVNVVNFLQKAAKANAICAIRFGREYSPVMYLTASRLKIVKSGAKRCSDREFEARKKRLLADVKKALGPAELAYEGNELRCWWD
jgi:hypothetical protein